MADRFRGGYRRALPSGSLGRAYLAFLESENITAAGIEEAAQRGQIRNDELQAPPSARRWGSRESANGAERPSLVITFTPPITQPPPPVAGDVPALSPWALGALGAALAIAAALALKR